MSKTTFVYQSELNPDILSMAVDQVADDLGWTTEDDGSGELSVKPPEGYSKHAMSFKFSAEADPEGGSQLVVHAHLSGLFTDKAPLQEEADRLNELIQTKGKVLTDKAIKDGYMCPTCGRLVEVGLLHCPYDGTLLKRS